MKYFIFDYTNDGIIWTGDNLVVGNKIREGLIDCDLTAIAASNKSYNLLTAEYLVNNHVRWSSKTASLDKISETDINEFYLKKKSLVSLRTRPMNILHYYIVWAYRKTMIFPLSAVDSEIQTELEQCIPNKNHYTSTIIEYARTCEITNQEAYKQLKLRMDAHRSQHIRFYAYFDKFSRMINLAETQEQINDITEEMIKKFVKDNYI